MSAETPVRFLASKTVCVSDVASKFTEGEEAVITSVFFCRQDPRPPIFRMEIAFEHSHQLSVFTGPLNRTVRVATLKGTVYDNEGNVLRGKARDYLQPFEQNEEYGWESLHRFKVHPSPNLNVKIILEIDYEASTSTEFPHVFRGGTLCNDFLHLLESSHNADVAILVKGETIMAHKTILTARSAYFRSLFDSGMKESVSKEVEIQDAEPNVVRGMLHFLYSASPPKDLAEIAMGLLVISDKYGLDELKTICESNICLHLTKETVVDALLLAEQHDCGKLMDCAKVVFLTNIDAVKRSKLDWDKLKADNDLLINLLQHYCSIMNESKVYGT